MYKRQIVTSLGHTPDVPSRNRTILIGLIRDIDNPKATRFELRAPNPFTNTYLAVSCLYLTALDGIRYAVTSGKTPAELLAEDVYKRQAGGFFHEHNGCRF